LIDGITRSGTSSFPSGHGCIRFCIGYYACAFYEKQNNLPHSFIACYLVAYSRIYLIAAFCCGCAGVSFIGVTVAVLVYHGFNIQAYKIKRKRKEIQFEPAPEFVEYNRGQLGAGL